MSGCKHGEVEKYYARWHNPHDPNRPRRWRCFLCGRPVSEEWARKVIRRKMRGVQRGVQRGVERGR